MCWIYHNTDEKYLDENIVGFEIEKGVCRVDLTQMKVHLWLDDLAVSACLGVDFVAKDNFQSIQSPCKIYYKGILIDTRNINKSGNLLEYINIQGGRKGRKLIQLSRNGFTQEGLLYIDSVLVPRIYRNLFDVLRTLASQGFVSAKKPESLTFSEKIYRNIRKSIEAALTEKNIASEKDWQKQLVGVSLYYNFYMREFEKKNLVYLSRREEREREQWDKAISSVAEVVGERRTDAMDIHSRLVVIEVYADLKNNRFEVYGRKEITIADFYNKKNKFAVVSKRRAEGDKWINSLIWLRNSEEAETPFPVVVDVLERAVAERNKKQAWAETLEAWADFMLENISGILESQPIQQSNFVLALLQSVSIRACFIDETGNLNVHILSGQPLGSVYYNIHAKYRLLKRMAKRKHETNAERFAGNVWMGYELLQVPGILEDVCSIKEQYIQENETFMVFPCSGTSVQKLIQFAEQQEEDQWFGGQLEERGQKEISAYLREMKSRLREMADVLYSCIVIEYENVKETSESFFIEKYVEYCRNEKVRTSEASFWDLLNSGYSLALGIMLRDELQKRAAEEEYGAWRKTSVESIKLEELERLVMERLPDEEEIYTLKGLIGICILNNSEAIIGGRELTGQMGLDLLTYMKMLTELCFKWEWLWKLVEHLLMELKTREIKKYFLESSTENDNLVDWISSKTGGEQYSVAECYDRIWNELIGAVIWKRESRIKNQNFRLLDWMGKKEENMRG